MNSAENRPPYLSIDEKIKYLDERHYFPLETITEDDRTRLGAINFHFFIGYARNFRYLHDNDAIHVPKTASEVFKIMDCDAEMSAYILSGVRDVEFRLRHFFVDALSSCACPYDDYLNPKNYQSFDQIYTPERLVDGLLRDILNYREAYVVNHIKSRCGDQGLTNPPENVDASNRNSVLALVDGLPLWSVVDSFTLGHLNRAIMTFRPPKSTDLPWKEVARSLSFKENRFDVASKSVLFLRNLTAHHNRLWMRPTSNTPTKSGLFRRKMNDAHSRSMVVAFYNLASMHGTSDARQFANGFQNIINTNPAYATGIMKISPDEADDKGEDSKKRKGKKPRR